MGPLFAVAAAGTAAVGAAVLRTVARERRGGVVSLLYHRVRQPEAYEALRGPERNFSVRSDRFEEQVRWLVARGSTFLTLDALHAVAAGQRPVPPRAVALTFDDGSASVAELAAPILARYGVPATVFVTADPAAWVFEDQARLDTHALRALVAQGWSVGAHGLSHHGLSELDDDALRHELVESRRRLEAELGVPVRDMAVPLNFYDARVLRAAEAAGYRMVFTANPGSVLPGDPLVELRRVAVEGGQTLDELQRSLRPLALARRRLVHAAKRVPPKLLGEARWMPLRRALFHSPLGPWLTARHLGQALSVVAVLWGGVLVLLAVSPL